MSLYVALLYPAPVLFFSKVAYDNIFINYYDVRCTVHVSYGYGKNDIYHTAGENGRYAHRILRHGTARHRIYNKMSATTSEVKCCVHMLVNGVPPADYTQTDRQTVGYPGTGYSTRVGTGVEKNTQEIKYQKYTAVPHPAPKLRHHRHHPLKICP